MLKGDQDDQASASVYELKSNERREETPVCENCRGIFVYARPK
jgi:hypothetical protein